MFYEIMSTVGRDFQKCVIELDKCGNEYVVYMEGQTKDGTGYMRETYKSIDQAMARYLIGVNLIGKSYGDFAYKCREVFGSDAYKMVVVE